MRLLLLWPLLFAAAAHAQEPKRVVVMYFDNNTARRDYDVLQKGLADMLVTDLSGVEALQVVEREKLQSLIDELRLQRSKYFDPKTAQKLGKVAGAEYAVTGALAELEPSLRIDIRLIEVASAKVILADKVTGKRDAFFDLQQELVDRFVTGLNVRLRASARAKSGVTDVDTLLKYSRGVDAADKGDLKVASTTLAEVVRDAPDFKLAKERYELFLKRLEAAGAKRSGILGGIEAELLKQAEESTQGGFLSLLPAAGPPNESEADFKKRFFKTNQHAEKLRTYFAWKVLRQQLYLKKLSERLPMQGNTPYMVYVVSPAERTELLPLYQAYAKATDELFKELLALSGREPHLRVQSNFDTWLPKEVEPRLKELQLAWGGRILSSSLSELLAEHALFLLTGRLHDGPLRITSHPSLAMLDKGVARTGLGYLESALKEASREQPEERAEAAVKALDYAAEGLLFLGRKEEALARWQRVLDEHPTHARYAEVEKKMKEVLCATRECKEFEAALASCSTQLMTKGAMELPRLARVSGADGLRRVKRALLEQCREPTPQMTYNMTQMVMLTQLGMQALNLGDCALYQEVTEHVRKTGGELYLTSFSSWSACN